MGRPDELTELSRHPTPARLERHSTSLDVTVRRFIASHEKTPLSVLQSYVHDEDKHVRGRTARNPGLDEKSLWVLVDDPEHEVQGYVSGHANATLEMLLELFHKGSWLHWCSIARHPLVNKKLARMLLDEQVMEVNANLAANPVVPEEILRELVAHPDGPVVGGLLRNPALPSQVLDLMPARYVPEGRLRRLYQDHPSLDMVLVLAKDWAGSLKNLLEAVEKLDVKV